jgi:predicted metal-dependent hydrolase
MKWPGFLQPVVNRLSADDAKAKPHARTNAHVKEQRDERSIALDGRPVDYLLVRRRGRRGVGLKIDGTGMTVAASLTTPIAVVEDMISKNAPWVLKKLGEWSHRKISPQRWETGATVPYLGETLTLMIDAGATRNHVEQVAAHLFVRLKVNDVTMIAAEAEKAVTTWYRRQALPHLAQRAFFFSKLHGLVPPRVFLSSANSRWGSCNSRREVRFSWRLIKARPALIDYVVCHELGHLRHMNHSSAFWQEVERMCPEYESLKSELDQNDHRFRAF